MQTNIDNSKTSEEVALRINSPIFYVPNPDKAEPLSFFNAYFGLPGRDPKLKKNQKTVYALQEDGVATPIEQPVVGGVGGTPQYNGTRKKLMALIYKVIAV